MKSFSGSPYVKIFPGRDCPEPDFQQHKHDWSDYAECINPFYAEILTTLSVELRKYGKQILFFHLDNPSKLQGLIHNVLQYRVDGIIITSISLTADLMDICIDYGLL